MKILLFVNTVQNFKNHNSLGGIEILNYELYKYLKKKHNYSSNIVNPWCNEL